jgi:uncharacterized protein YndB with AHSA1/START domain
MMIHYTISQLIRLPRREVFRMLERPEAIPVWNPAIESARPVTGGDIGQGSRFLLRRTSPQPAIEEVEVIQHEPGRRMVLHGDFGPFVGALDYLLEDAPEGTRVVHVAHLQPKGPLRFIAPLASSRVRAAVAANLDRLRRHLEQTGRAHLQDDPYAG